MDSSGRMGDWLAVACLLAVAVVELAAQPRRTARLLAGGDWWDG